MKKKSILRVKTLWIAAVLATAAVLLAGCHLWNGDDTVSGDESTATSVVQTEWKGDQEKAGSQPPALDNPIVVESKKPAPPEKPAASESRRSGPYAVQVGAFLNKKYADRMMARLREKGYEPTLKVSEAAVKEWNLVRVGQYPDKSSADQLAEKLSREENTETAVVKNDTIVKVHKKPSIEKNEIAQSKSEDGSGLILSYPSTHYRYAFQVGGLHDRENAVKHQNILERKGYKPFIVKVQPDQTDETWYAVRIGYFDSIDQAAEAADQFTMKESIPTEALAMAN